MELNQYAPGIGAFGGGAVGYVAARATARSETAQDVFSVVGGVRGQRKTKLPVINKYAAAWQARQMAKQMLAGQELHPVLRSAMVDGLATHLAVEMRDPNKLINAGKRMADTYARGGAELIGSRFPSVASEADAIAQQAAKLSDFFTTQGIHVANATIGANVGRGALRVGSYGVAAAGAVAGAVLASSWID